MGRRHLLLPTALTSSVTQCSPQHCNYWYSQTDGLNICILKEKAAGPALPTNNNSKTGDKGGAEGAALCSFPDTPEQDFQTLPSLFDTSF